MKNKNIANIKFVLAMIFILFFPIMSFAQTVKETFELFVADEESITATAETYTLPETKKVIILTAAQMDALLEIKEVNAAIAAYFALGAAGLLPQDDGYAAAYDSALSRGWIKTASDDAVTLQETAFLVMNAFELKGGIMYSIFHNPRYAYREMVYNRLIQGHSYSSNKVSGIDLLRILDRTQNYSMYYGEEN